MGARPGAISHAYGDPRSFIRSGRKGRIFGKTDLSDRKLDGRILTRSGRSRFAKTFGPIADLPRTSGESCLLADLRPRTFATRECWGRYMKCLLLAVTLSLAFSVSNGFAGQAHDFP